MKTVLITGVSRGIGRALTEKFLNEGHYVIGTSTNGNSDIVSENFKIVKLDLSDSKSILECVNEIKSLDIKIDILINNAAIAIDKEDTKVAINSLRNTLEVNLIGTIDFTEQIIPLLNDGAHILNSSSSAGSLFRTKDSDDDQFPAYRISKTALNMYTRTLAIHLKDKITVSSYHPGWVKTDMGGDDAPMTPEEAIPYVYDLAISNPETGQFWFKGEIMPW